jgi:hypothetical protein
VRELDKKKDEEMLVVHPTHPDASRVARAAVAPGMDALPADVDRLAERLRRTSAEGRPHLIAAIHGRFGNAFAGRVIAASERGRRGGSRTGRS